MTKFYEEPSSIYTDYAKLKRERETLLDVLQLIQGQGWRVDGDNPTEQEIRRRALNIIKICGR